MRCRGLDRGTLVAAALVSCLIPSTTRPAVAGGFQIAEMGVRRTAMAAVIGRPDEPAAVLHNPAGLSLLSDTRLYVSMGLALIDTEFRLAPWEGSDAYIDEPVGPDGRYPTTEPSRAFGVIPMIVLATELIEDKLHAAATLYVSNATGSKFPENAVTRYHLVEGYIVAPQVSLLVSYQAHPKVSVGAGVGIMHLRLHGRRKLFPIIGETDATALLGGNSELVVDGKDYLPTWNAGVLLTPLPGLSIGASIVGKAEPSMEGPVEVRQDEMLGGFVFEGQQKTSLLLPWTFNFGVNFDIHPNVEVGSELRYWLYRQYDEQVIEVEGLPLIEELVTPKNYRDSYQIAGGVRVHDISALRGAELMAGLHYDRTPAPSKTVSFDQPTFSNIGLHSGVRFETGRFRLGASYVRYWYDIPDIEDSVTSPPSNIRGDGVNNIFTLTMETTFGMLTRP